MSQAVHDVLIIGAGMVGAAAGCLLARAGFSVAVIESKQAAAFNPQDPVGLRVSALSPGSEAVLREAGAWRAVSLERHCPYRQMRVEDRQSGAVLEFNAGEFGLERLGTIVENDLLRWSLWNCLESLGGVERVCPADVVRFDPDIAAAWLRDGREFRARVLVGADGSESAVRTALGIGQQTWHYGQLGVVTVVTTQRPNQGIAWQRFLPGGPLALLPLSDGRSSIVWSLPDAEARRLLDLDAPAFCTELDVMAGPGRSAEDSLFGGVLGCGSRAAFPLHMQLSDTYTARRGVLIGDAAHVVHPLAGQGVNLGLADSAALLETLVAARRAGEDIGSEKVLRRFARWRRSEAELMARGIHGIRTVFTPEPLAPLRRLGLGLVSRSWSLKEAFIRRAVGRNHNAPALARGVHLSELMKKA